MAAKFTIGSNVLYTTCFKQNIEGEVVSFDPATKMLMLKCAPSESTKRSDVYILNVALCSNFQIKDKVAIPESPRSLNIQRLGTRARNAVDQKKKWVSAMSAGACPEGQKLYMVISKTIDQVTWKDQNIVVFNDVIIQPPYNVENVVGKADSRQVAYVKKIVEKFAGDQMAGDESTSLDGITAALSDTYTSFVTSSTVTASNAASN